MSIYCSYHTIANEHSAKCRRITKVRGGFKQDDSKSCTCGNCPIAYQGSHVLPTDNDRRDGEFGISAIPSHIANDGEEDPERDWLPWLRVHLSAGERDTLILDRGQVEKLYEAIGTWLKDSSPVRN